MLPTQTQVKEALAIYMKITIDKGKKECDDSLGDVIVILVVVVVVMGKNIVNQSKGRSGWQWS